MVAACTSSFKIITVRPELAGRRILMIHALLQEINYNLQAGRLQATGIIAREIRYQTEQGVRRTVDRLQFALQLGECLELPSEGWRTFLKQDYFLWSMETEFKETALLEQGFTLELREQLPVVESRSVELTEIVATGTESFLLEFSLTLPRDAKPEELRGEVLLAADKRLPFFTGELRGVLRYCNAESVLEEVNFSREFTTQLAKNLWQDETCWRIQGAIAESVWIPECNGQDWLITVKLNYQWWLLREQTFCCPVAKPDGSESLMVQTLCLLKHGNWESLQTLVVDFVAPPTAEVSLSVQQQSTRLTRNGLLVSSELLVTTYLIRDGREVLAEFPVAFEELIPQLNGVSLENNQVVLLELQPCLQNFTWRDGRLELMVLCNYQFQIKKRELVCLSVSESSPVEVLVKTVGEVREFSLMKTETLQLAQLPERIISLQSKLLNYQSKAYQGWLAVQGRLEVLVNYATQESEYREEIFCFFFQANFVWEELLPEVELELAGLLEYDRYQQQGKSLNYQALLSFRGHFLLERQVKLALSNRMPLIKVNERSDLGYSICLEQQLKLTGGKLFELVEQQATVAELSWERSGEILWMRGVVLGQLEYWNQQGYLCTESFSHTFQKSLPALAEELNWSAWVKELKLLPLKQLLWQKERFLLQLELALENLGGEE